MSDDLISPENLKDQLWRLNNLYWIITEKGERVKFKLNWAQTDLYHSMWYLNIVLKARQLGFSTFIDIFILDTCLFNGNIKAGIIADTQKNATDLFATKIEYPYLNLPDTLRAVQPLMVDQAGHYRFANNSEINVGVSLRSGTYQLLHISEYGKTSVNNPKRAVEIKTGALNTVHPGQMVFIESTAEGHGGEFYDMVKTSRDQKSKREPLTELDYKFHFYPWWRHPGYVLPHKAVTINQRMQDYFRELEEKHGIELSRAQKAWYVKKEREQGEFMKREHPSTPDEAFEAALKGTYYAVELRDAREADPPRITRVPHYEGIPVDTWWDLGLDDYTAIWFTQTVGREIHAIYYYENSDVGLDFYARYLRELAEERGYFYGIHKPPHDMDVREIGNRAMTRLESAREYGLVFDDPVPRAKFEADNIAAVRFLFRFIYFDEAGCEQGLEHLSAFRKEWDDVRGVYKETARKDEHKHAADALATLARGHEFKRPTPPRRSPQPRPAGWT